MKDRRFIDVDVCINRLKEQMKDAPDEHIDYLLHLSNEIETEYHAQETEQALFWKLPCKVGDYVYRINRVNGKITTKKVLKIELEIRGENSYTMQIWLDDFSFCFESHFGNIVFLTKLEAEQALQKQRTGT